MEILLIFGLILLNGIFSMSEIAMVSSKKSRLETAAKKGDKSARKAFELANNPGKFLSTVQIGITLIGILTGIFSGEKIQDDLIQFLQGFSLLEPYSNLLSTSIIVILLTFFSLVLGELVPKRIGLAKPEQISKLLAYPMHLISIITAPFTWMLTATSDLILKVIPIKIQNSSNITEEEIKAIIQEGTQGGVIQEIEKDIMDRVFSLGDRKISSLMTHRTDTVFLKSNLDAQSTKEIVLKEMHSVYPVINEKSEVKGVIFLKDLFKHINDPDFRVGQYVNNAEFVPENLSAYEVMKIFKTSKSSYAFVIDEFGQMEGLVTMNDLLEALVGDVSDFYETEFTFLSRSDGTWLIDGQYPFADFLRKFEMEELFDDYPFNTLSGLILDKLRKIPKTGEKINWLDFTIEIMDMDGARIDKVLISRKFKN